MLSLEEKELLLKYLRKGDAISRENIAGGALNRDQADAFIDLTVNQSVLLKQVRVERRDNPSGEINKMNITQPITRGATIFTGTKYSPTFGNALSTSAVQYNTVKLLSFYIVPTEILEENIEQEGFANTLAEAAAKQFATDLEELAIYGDEDLPAPGGNPSEEELAHYYLRKSNNGFLKQMTAANGCIVIDAEGKPFDKKLASKAWRALPNKYKMAGKENFRFFCSPNVEQDWRDQVADRGTALGDENLQDLAPARPFGIPMISIPMWPENLGATQDRTKVVLTVPKNLIFVVSRDIRVYKMFDPERDSWISLTYTRNDFIIENPEIVVVLENVKPNVVA